MDSLSFDRHIKQFSVDMSKSYFTPAFGALTAMPAKSFHTYSYEPLFSFSPSYGGINSPALFDSNIYFNNFTLSSMPVMQPMMDFLSFLPDFSSFVMPTFVMPTFTLPKLTLPKITTKKKSSLDLSNYKFDTSVKFKSLKEAGYNKKLAKKLAKDVAAHAESSSTGYCAKYVSNAMERLGIVGKRGDAWELRDSLRNNPHFKEVDVNSVDVKNLPAGCVLVYQRGDAGYSSQYGHVEITLGNGKAASDFINNNIKKSSNMSVFVPVSA